MCAHAPSLHALRVRRVIFVSHTWLGWHYPDQERKKWLLLQQFIRHARCDASVRTDWMAQKAWPGIKMAQSEIKRGLELSSGLKWHNVSHTRPKKGHELKHEALKAALLRKSDNFNHRSIEFTSTEWAALGVSGLKADHFIQVGEEYFMTDEPGYIWIDYACTPQDDLVAQADAMRSIPSYVAESSYFVALAGPWTHTNDSRPTDLRAWGSRGWCRFEALALALSPPVDGRKKAIIAVESPTVVSVHGPSGLTGLDWISNPVGAGDFRMPEDKELLGPVIEALIDRRMKLAADSATADEMVWFRLLRCLKPHLLSGTSMPAAPAESLDEWMSAMRFSSCADDLLTGLTPLTYAVLTGSVALVEALLAKAGPDLAKQLIAAPLKQAYPAFDWSKGETPLDLLLRSKPDAEMVKLLLARGAVYAAPPAAAGTDCVCAAVAVRSGVRFFGEPVNMEVLLRHTPSLLDSFESIFIGTCLSGKPAYVRHLLDTYPEQSKRIVERGGGSKGGLGLLSAIVTLVGDSATLRILLEAGCQPDQLGAQSNAFGAWLSRLKLQLFKRRPTVQTLFGAYILSGPAMALQAASFKGDMNALNLLLEHGADVNSVGKQPYRLTPLHLACLYSHDAVARKLVDAGAHVGAVDKKKRTPPVICERRGDASLAAHLHWKKNQQDEEAVKKAFAKKGQVAPITRADTKELSAYTDMEAYARMRAGGGTNNEEIQEYARMRAGGGTAEDEMEAYARARAGGGEEEEDAMEAYARMRAGD